MARAITQGVCMKQRIGMPRICVLKTDGTNCDQETAYAFAQAGGNAQIVTINQLHTKQVQLKDFDILAIPGGFSYGDDIASGKVFAIELLSFVKDELLEFVAQKKLIIGICNGFQVLVRTGLLPFTDLGNISVALTDNASGTFECRWVNMKVEKSPCVFTQSLIGQEVTFQAAHAEGNFFTDDATLKKIEDQGLVVLRYALNSVSTQEYPANPNGALHAIAGMCDATGRIFGLMPHPERFVEMHQHPNWRRRKMEPHGLPIFKNAIQYIQNL